MSTGVTCLLRSDPIRSIGIPDVEPVIIVDEGADAATGHEVETEIHQGAVATQCLDVTDAVGELPSLRSKVWGVRNVRQHSCIRSILMCNDATKSNLIRSQV